MGNANCTVKNKTWTTITVKTWNWADAGCSIPWGSYDIKAGEEQCCEAAAHGNGLKYQINASGKAGPILGASNGQHIEVTTLPT